MKQQYILSIDQSTSGTKAILFDRQLNPVKRCTIGHRQYYPKPGFVEHDPEEIYANVLNAIKRVMSETNAVWPQVASISVTNQRETGILWDGETGKPVYNAVVWQCRRAEQICSEIGKKGADELIRGKTGLTLSPYFTAGKIKWILDNVPYAKELAARGSLLFGTVDTWLLWKLTGGCVHATDYSNASRTLLFNIHTLTWDRELLGLFTIPESAMPELKYSDDLFGYTHGQPDIPDGVPISGVLGDSHAALFGQCCFHKGMAKATYGTGSSVMMNTGALPVISNSGLVASLAWGMNGKVGYVLEGNINFTGGVIKWLVEDLGLIPDSGCSGEIAGEIPDNGGVYLVPAFSGLGAPYWDSLARATITGMAAGAKKAHIVRAAEESIAYQIKDIADRMQAEAGIALAELRADGGPTRDSFLMQFQADMLDMDVVTTDIEELSALGSAGMAGLAAGLWTSPAQLQSLRKESKRYSARMPEEIRDRNYTGWKEAVNRTLSIRNR